MFNLPVTYTEIAQKATQLAVSVVATGVITTAVERNTEIDTENNKFAELGCTALGYVVGLRLKPLTDTVIEKIATKLSRNKVAETVETTTA